MKTISIKQGCMLSAAPRRVYNAFLDSRAHTEITGDDAQITAKVGGHFSVFSGWATGTSVELQPGKKIVQTWRASDWPKDTVSTITIRLLPAPDGKTKLLFQHDNVPSGHAKSIARGWRDYYWSPMKEYFKTKS